MIRLADRRRQPGARPRVPGRHRWLSVAIDVGILSVECG